MHADLLTGADLRVPSTTVLMPSQGNRGHVGQYWSVSDPGFAVDEDSDKLGENSVLPPFLEPQRANIIRNLKPID